MTDELIAKLSNVSALRVISRTSAMHYKGLKKSLPEIARELQVDAVVEGSVLRSNDRVRINARLIQVPAERQLWADGYERDIRDVLALQSDVAAAIVREIRVKLSPGESSHLAAQAPVDPEAYQLYLQGRTSFSRSTPDSLTKAAEYFNLAIAKDPGYALAYTGLADSYIQLAGRLLPPRDVMPKAKAAIERALALNESLGEAHSSLAQVKLFYEFDWNGAQVEYRRALEMSPGSPLIHQMNGLLLASKGRAEESLAEAGRVLDSDPVSSSSGCLRARLLYYAHRYDQSIEQYRKTVASDPTATGSCTWAIFSFHKRGRVAEGIAAAKQAVDVSPNEMLPRATLARGYGISGNRQEAERVIRELEEISKRRFVSEYEFAAAYSGWNPEQSLAWLEKGYAGRVGMLVYLGVDSAFDELRSDPRFADLLRRIGISR
jgi:tetratricopeptide (TPR) repeat protein